MNEWAFASGISIETSSWLCRKYRETFNLPVLLLMNSDLPHFSWQVSCSLVSYLHSACISPQTLPYSVDYEVIITVIVIKLLVYIYLLSRDCDWCFTMYDIISPENPFS